MVRSGRAGPSGQCKTGSNQVLQRLLLGVLSQNPLEIAYCEVRRMVADRRATPGMEVRCGDHHQPPAGVQAAARSGRIASVEGVEAGDVSPGVRVDPFAPAASATLSIARATCCTAV